MLDWLRQLWRLVARPALNCRECGARLVFKDDVLRGECWRHGAYFTATDDEDRPSFFAEPDPPPEASRPGPRAINLGRKGR